MSAQVFLWLFIVNPLILLIGALGSAARRRRRLAAQGAGYQAEKIQWPLAAVFLLLALLPVVSVVLVVLVLSGTLKI